MVDFGKILAKWRLRGVLNDIIASRDYIKNNKYDIADLLLVASQVKLKKLLNYYNTQTILKKIEDLRLLLNQEKGKYSENTKSQIESLFENIMMDSEKMLKKPSALNLVPECS